MRVNVRNIRIYIEETTIVALFVCILSRTARDYLESYYLCFLFIAFHECSHIFVANLLGASAKAIYIKLSGLSVKLEKTFTGIKALLIYFAGPISNIVLAILFKEVSIIFEINMALAVINLVPIYPLDGYNILKSLLQVIDNKNVTKLVLKIASTIAEISMICLGAIFTIAYCNISITILLLYIKFIKLSSAK